MVNVASLDSHPLPAVLTTEPAITLQYPDAPSIPCSSVASLVTCLTGLVLLPAITFMLITVAAAIGRGVPAASFSTGFWRSRWHSFPFQMQQLRLN